MNSMLRSILGGCVMAVAVAASAHAQQVRVGIAAEPYPPFASPDAAGNWVGWEVDFVKAVCAEAKLDCVIAPTAWDGIIPSLNTNRIDAIAASMSVTADRLKEIDFSDKYYQTKTLVIGAKGDTFDATPEGLNGKTLGVQVATIYQPYAMKHFAPNGVTVKDYQTQDEANADLAAGRIDAVLADALAMEAFLDSDTGKQCCEEKGAVSGDAEILGPGIAFGLRKGDAELKEKLNAGIKAIRANGTYDTITKKYFDFDIYGD